MQYIDESSGVPYYYSETRRESSWTLPIELQDAWPSDANQEYSEDANSAAEYQYEGAEGGLHRSTRQRRGTLPVTLQRSNTTKMLTKAKKSGLNTTTKRVVQRTFTTLARVKRHGQIQARRWKPSIMMDCTPPGSIMATLQAKRQLGWSSTVRIHRGLSITTKMKDVRIITTQ